MFYFLNIFKMFYFLNKINVLKLKLYKNIQGYFGSLSFSEHLLNIYHVLGAILNSRIRQSSYPQVVYIHIWRNR